MFYVEAWKSDGNLLLKQSDQHIGFGLYRHYKAVYGIDIINDPEFGEANKVFLAKCVELNLQGLVKVEHKSPICGEVLKNYTKAVPSFNQNNPKTLRAKAFFQILLYFC